MQVSRNVRRRESDAERSLRQWLSVLLVSRLEEALGLPPIVMGSFDLDGVVAGSREIARDVY